MYFYRAFERVFKAIDVDLHFGEVLSAQLQFAMLASMAENFKFLFIFHGCIFDILRLPDNFVYRMVAMHFRSLLSLHT